MVRVETMPWFQNDRALAAGEAGDQPMVCASRGFGLRFAARIRGTQGTDERDPRGG